MSSNMKVYLYFLSFHNTEKTQVDKFFPFEKMDLFILHMQYHACQWAGDSRSPINNNHNRCIDQFIFEYFVFSTCKK